MSDNNNPHVSSTSNGQAYQAYLASTLAILDQLAVDVYYTSPLPSPADEALTEIVSAFTAWPRDVRQRFTVSLPADKRGLFGIFGHRAATLAVRRGDPELLRLGLIANVIANSPIPEKRNVEAALAVFYHCARKLELDPHTLFEEAVPFATDKMAERLMAFADRPDVKLKQFGWREIRTADGVRYKFEW